MDEDASLDEFRHADDDQEATPAAAERVNEADEDAENADEEVENANDDAENADEPDDELTNADEDVELVDESDDEAEDADAPLRVDPSSVEPATATHDWRPDGGACAACGEVVERRWRDDPGLVCGSCKAW